MRVEALLALPVVVALASAGCLTHILGGDPSPSDYVSSKTYTRWVIEMDAVSGQAPSQGALDLLKGRLDSVANKPDGIEVRQGDTLSSHGGTWSLKDVTDIASSSRDVKTSGKTVATHLLFLDGTFEQENVLGIAIGHDTIALFSQTIKDVCSPVCLTGTDSIFRAVLVHEFGHAMGLVNNGIAMQTPHEDPAHPAHSNSRSSVMYWEVETTNIVNVFQGGPPTDYDANDRVDLCAAGGKC